MEDTRRTLRVLLYRRLPGAYYFKNIDFKGSLIAMISKEDAKKSIQRIIDDFASNKSYYFKTDEANIEPNS